MKEEQVPATPRVLDGILDELLDRARLVGAFDLLGARSEGERSLLLFDADMADATVELYCQREDVVQVGAVADDETAVRLV